MTNPHTFTREVLRSLDEALTNRATELGELAVKAEHGEIPYTTYDSTRWDWDGHIVGWAEAVVRAAKADGLIPR